MSKYLDFNGLSYFWGKLKGYFQKKQIWYGTCPTAAGTNPKVVTTTSGDFVLAEGNMLRVMFDSASGTSSTPTINVDGTGTKNVFYIDTNGGGEVWIAHEVVDLVYDGTKFVLSEAGRATTSYYGVTKLSSSVSSTSTALAATASAVRSAYNLADSKQDELVSGTNIKTINGNSLLGSGDMSVGGSGTSTPTADEVAEFDSTAHMNSTDMTTGSGGEVEGFINDLNISNTPIVDYIVEQGTSGVWTYRKWNSGLYECWGKTDVASRTYANNGSYNVIENLPMELPSGAIMTVSGNISTVALSEIGYTECGTQTCQTYLINRSGSSVTKAGTVYWNVKGRWK